MKKALVIIACVILVFIIAFVGLSAFTDIFEGEVKYTANTRFLYSTDNGASWSETVQTVYTGEPYYLAVEMQVVQSRETDEENIVEAVIAIPNTNVLDCYLDDHHGTSITGEADLENNTVTYKFHVVAGTNPSKFRVVFECMPISDGKATVTVNYDDHLSDAWDATGSIKYIKKEQ